MDEKYNISIMQVNGKRGTIKDHSILNGVDLVADKLISPIETISNFVNEEDKEKFNALVKDKKLDKPLNFDLFDNDTFWEYVNSIINEMSRENIKFDIRLLEISQKRASLGFASIFEQFEFKLQDLNDVEFNEFYNNLKNELKNNNPSFAVFLSKNENIKTIKYTTFAKIISNISDDKPLKFTYQGRKATDPYFNISKNTKDASKVNYNYEKAVKDIFKVSEKMGIDSIIKIGSIANFKSHYFKEDELSNYEDQLSREKELQVILDSSKRHKGTYNNPARGSMSPNTSKEYIESKNVDEELLGLEKQSMDNINEALAKNGIDFEIDSLIRKKEELDIKRKELLDNGNAKESNNLAGKMFDLTQKINKLKKQKEDNKNESIETKESEIIEVAQKENNEEIIEVAQKENNEEIIEVAQKEEIIEKPIEKNENKTDSTIEMVSFIEKELQEVLEKELASVSLANTRKIEEAPKVANEMMKDFRVMFETGGSLISNLEKINQKYRDNIYAYEIFNAQLKYELKASILKDKAIGSLNLKIHDLKHLIEEVEKKSNDKINILMTDIKKLTDDNDNLKEANITLDKEFEEYSVFATSKLEEFRDKLNQATLKNTAYEEQLKEFEEFKIENAKKDEYIIKSDETLKNLANDNNLLKNRVEFLEGKLKNHEQLVAMSSTQTELLNSLRVENKELKDNLNVTNASLNDIKKLVKDLELTNQKLKEQKKELEEKIVLMKEVRVEVKNQVQLTKEIEAQQKNLEKEVKKTVILKPLTTEEITLALAKEQTNSEGWHRLNLVKLGDIDLRAIEKKFAPELTEKVKIICDDLLSNNMAYINEKTGNVVIKDNAKRVLVDNPSASFEVLLKDFKELQGLKREEYVESEESDNTKKHSIRKVSK